MTTPVVPAGSGFGLANLPYGVYSTSENGERRCATRVGDTVVDLASVLDRRDRAAHALFASGSLARFMRTGPAKWAQVREELQQILTGDVPDGALHPADSVHMHLPCEFADYVDFYASENHAANLGRLFRPDNPDPLMPNWKHLPVGYHGRSSTIVPSGVDVVRPKGQRKGPNDPEPVFGPSTRLDIEAEMGFVVGVGNDMGTSISTEDASNHLFGAVIFNDWSARDIQAWEYVPLGPFLGKSFATSISGWVLPLAALKYARIEPPARDVPLQDYLKDVPDQPWGLDIDIEVQLNGEVVSRPPYAQMYWTGAQMLAHTTINGASVRTGDFYASGTISGKEVDQRGALIEMTWGGRDPITLSDGSTRTFLEDGDEIVLTATARGRDGRRIGLGECRGRITPAR